MAIKLVVTDMDNTLYSWVDYIVPAVEAMINAVCQVTDWPRIQVVQSLKAVYTQYESNEYPFALQESSLFRSYPDFGSFDKLIIEPARIAFKEARRKYLRPYRGVVETLEVLREKRIPVVALTDAPKNPAEQRAKLLGLDQYLQALYTLPGFDFPAGDDGAALVAPDILHKEVKGDYRAACPVVELPRHYEKPNPQGLLQICKEQQVDPREVLVVGDSLKKDMAVAREVGALGAWAEYGTYVSLDYRERLDVISAASITRRHAASLLDGSSNPVPDHALSNYAGLLALLR